MDRYAARRLVRNRFRGMQVSGSRKLSEFRKMWLVVFFDLPIGSKQERKDAAKFRKRLIGEGFSMKQLSVYERFFDNRDKAIAAADRIGRFVPPYGKVSTLFVTDKQMQQIRNYYGGVRDEPDQAPTQLALF